MPQILTRRHWQAHQLPSLLVPSCPSSERRIIFVLPRCRLQPSYGSRQPLPLCDVAVADGLHLPYRSGEFASLLSRSCQLGATENVAFCLYMEWKIPPVILA